MKKSFVDQKLVAFASYIDDADARVGSETAAESGDENLKAA